MNDRDQYILKGYNPQVDSYSGFLSADKKEKTKLDALLKANRIDSIFTTGNIFCSQSIIVWSRDQFCFLDENRIYNTEFYGQK
jgi:hypothetical protein